MPSSEEKGQADRASESRRTPWTPLRQPAFRTLWAAAIVSNMGTWMNDVGAGWLMTTLDHSPLMVASVQAATTLPIFLFALPAGALADIADRRKVLVALNAMACVTAALLATLVFSKLISVPLLLSFTFLLGASTAFAAPAWQAIVPSLVPRQDLPSALALNSMGVNISRAVGPALAGLLIASVGLASPFLINAVSFLAIIGALIWWKPPSPRAESLPPEPMGRAVLTGLRYVMSSRPLIATLVRAAAFFIFASAYWAFLPLIARHSLSGGPEQYGLLLGCLGAGAVLGAFSLPRLQSTLGPNGVAALGTASTALAMVVFAVVQDPYAAGAAALLAGASWISVLASLNVSAQTALPNWVRARGLSVFLTVFFGAMSGGSLFWGRSANTLGIDGGLLIAAGGALLFIPLTWSFKLGQGEALDLSPSMHWPQPSVLKSPDHGRGPVMVQIEYRIDPLQADPFLRALYALREFRHRSGAYRWGVFEDAEDPGKYVECYLAGTWIEHLRQHERVTQADKELEQAVHQFHVGERPPRVRHLLGAEHSAKGRFKRGNGRR